MFFPFIPDKTFCISSLFRIWGCGGKTKMINYKRCSYRDETQPKPQNQASLSQVLTSSLKLMLW